VAATLAAARLMDLQPLFAAPIIEQYAYPAAYTDHTNDVWRVRTAHEVAVVRAPRPAAELDSTFWRGCRHLFSLDPTQIARLATTNALLAGLSPLPIPRVLRSGTVAGRQCLVVEHLPGETLHDLHTLPAAALRELGAVIARIHRQRFLWYGTLDGALQRPLDDFHHDLAATMRFLVKGFVGAEAPLAAPLEDFCALAMALPAPTTAAPVMLDVDATQFLSDGVRITALVDTDAYAVAPRELDFIGYEYELDAPGAAAFAAGYRTHFPLPDLTAVRPVYRYLYHLMGTQGAVPLDEWLAWPSAFS